MRKSLTKVLLTGLEKSFPSGTVPVRPGGGLLGWVREPFAGAWQQGVSADPIGSLTSFGAVFACVNRIAGDVAKLAIGVKVKDQRHGVWTDVPEGLPIHDMLRRPNAYQTLPQFLSLWFSWKLLYGNAYAVKVRDSRGAVVALYPLDPRRVTPMVTPRGDVYYSLGGDDLSRVPTGMVVPAREIIHDRGLTLWHPLVGVSPIVACAISATQGNRIQANSALFFQNMSRPSGMLTAPGEIDDPTADRLKKEFETNFGGGNIGRLLVAGSDLKYAPMTIPATDSQLIEQLAWTVEDVARCFQVPLYKINAGPMPTAGNVEELDGQYYGGTLQSLMEAFEAVLDLGLELPHGMRTEFDIDGLLRMDTSTRFEALGKGVSGGWMAPNEARRRENLKPLLGGDSVYLQQQNYSLEALAKRDARADPFATAGNTGDAAAAGRRAIETEVAKALDDLIDGLPAELRSAMLQSKDTKWLNRMAQGQWEAEDAVTKELSPEMLALTSAQTDAADAQRRAADEWAAAAQAQRDAAQQVVVSVKAAEFIRQQQASTEKYSRPWTYEMVPERDSNGLIVSVMLKPVAQNPSA